MVVSGHATTLASLDRRICLPRAESSGGADADFRQRTGLRGVRGGDRAGEGAVAGAGVGMVRAAQSLAFCALAARRRRPVGVHALVDGHPHATLARRASHRRQRPALPGAFQVVSDSGRRPFMDGAPLCGAKSAAGEHGRSGGCLAMVEPLASRARQQSWTFGRRAAAIAAPLATARSDTAERSRVTGVAAISGAWFTLWGGVVAGADREALGPAIHVTSAWLAVAKTTKIKTPDPFIFPPLYILIL